MRYLYTADGPLHDRDEYIRRIQLTEPPAPEDEPPVIIDPAVVGTCRKVQTRHSISLYEIRTVYEDPMSKERRYIILYPGNKKRRDDISAKELKALLDNSIPV